MLKLTDLRGKPLWLNPDHVVLVRDSIGRRPPEYVKEVPCCVVSVDVAAGEGNDRPLSEVMVRETAYAVVSAIRELAINGPRGPKVDDCLVQHHWPEEK